MKRNSSKNSYQKSTNSYGAYTFVEMLITMMVFMIIALIVSVTVTTLIRVSLATSAKIALRSESDFLMETITRTIRNSSEADVVTFYQNRLSYDGNALTINAANLPEEPGPGKPPNLLVMNSTDRTKTICLAFLAQPSVSSGAEETGVDEIEVGGGNDEVDTKGGDSGASEGVGELDAGTLQDFASADLKGYIARVSMPNDPVNPLSDLDRAQNCFDKSVNEEFGYSFQVLNSSEITVNAFEVVFNQIEYGNSYFSIYIKTSPIRWIKGPILLDPHIIRRQFISTDKLTY